MAVGTIACCHRPSKHDLPQLQGDALLLHGMTIFKLLSPATPKARARNRIAIGLFLSVVIHVVLFVVLQPNLKKIDMQPIGEHAPLEVTFVKPTAIAKPAPAQPTPAKQAVKKAPTPKPRQIVRAKPQRSAPASASVPVAPSPTAITRAPPEMDMSTMINSARERRRAAESSAAAENAAARAAEQGPSGEDIARENIAFQARKRGGTNGVFEIVSKGPRIAQYIFRGWSTDARNNTRQTITVDAGPNGNVERAIVDSIITIIRKYYTGDFNWDSQRLGRIVPLSARPEDTAGLQAFLMAEFFK